MKIYNNCNYSNYIIFIQQKTVSTVLATQNTVIQRLSLFYIYFIQAKWDIIYI